MMPQSQKFVSAVNQQEFDLAYIIGVYMGDGCITKGHFHFKSIDEDFAEVVAAYLRLIGFTVKCSMQFQHINAFGKKPLFYVDGYDSELCSKIESMTHKKTLLPSFIFSNDELKKKFFTGFFDSDGWVNINVSPKTGTIRLQLGIAKCGEYIHDIHKLIVSLGVKCQKIQTRILPSGKVLKRVRFNPQSFMESGLCSNISRKQDRIDAYRDAVDIAGSKRKRPIFNDYKEELLLKSLR